MKRKSIVRILTIALFAVVSALSFAACAKQTAKHTHKYDQRKETVEYAVVPSTCTEAGEYYYSCSCGAKGSQTFVGEALGHTGGTATCTEKAVCGRCNEPYGDLAEHKYGAAKVTKEATRTEKGVSTEVCLNCRYEKNTDIEPTGHSGEWTVILKVRCFEDGKKQRVCSVCDEIEFDVVPMIGHHELENATCVGGKECKNCGYVEGSGKGHEFTDWTFSSGSKLCTEEHTESRRCNTCNKTEYRTIFPRNHTFDGNWQIDREATCSATGSKSRLCLACGSRETREIDRIPHRGEWTEAKAPTCTEKGKATRNCSVCTAYEEKDISATGHSGEWTITKQSTCTAKGKSERVCTTCGKTETKDLALAEHSGEYVVIKSATCTQNGEKRRICDVCGQTSTLTIMKTAHTYSDWTTQSEATCAAKGVKTRYCYACQNVDTQYLPMKEHVGEWKLVSKPTCTTDGERQKVCTECGNVEKESIDKLGHDMVGGSCVEPARCSRCGALAYSDYEYGEEKVIESPDCERRGHRIKICAKCGDVYDIYEGPAGHDYGEWSIRLAPTCVKDGKERRQCITCGRLQDRVAEMLGHNYGEWEIDEERTCDFDGLRHADCLRCGDTKEETLTAYGHDFGEGSCYTDRACSHCGALAQKHVYGDNGCTICGLKYTDLNYELSSDGTYYIVKGCNESAPETMFIRQTYNGKPVREIDFGDSSPAFVKSIKTVIFPEGLKKIGNNCFFQSKLKSVYLPEGVEIIGMWAFSSNTELKTVVVPDSVVEIGSRAFHGTRWLNDYPDGIVYAGKTVYTFKNSDGGNKVAKIRKGALNIASGAFGECTWLMSVVIPEGVKRIGYSAFSDCTSLTEVTIPESVISVWQYAFSDCESLETVTISDGVEEIGGGAFDGCTSLLRVTIPESVTSLGDAFGGCTSLLSATILGKIETLETFTFYRCSALAEITLPSTLKHIKRLAFCECSSLKSVIIPDGVTTIEDKVFDGCSSLKSAVIPDSVTSIESSVFEGCTSLESLTLPFVGDKAENAWRRNLGFLFGTNYYNNGDVPSSLKTVTVRNTKNVVDLSREAFEGCSSITSVIIGEGVKRVGSFRNCTSLISVTISDDAEYIDDSAFDGCSALKSVVFGSGIYSIERGMFRGCTSLTDLTIGNGLYRIERGAFKDCPITSVKYNGTKAEWESEVENEDGWHCDKIKRVICTDGIITVNA